MQKLGLVSVFNYNYGSLLQTYAMQQELNDRGVDNEIIFYKKKNVFKQFLRLFNFNLVVMKGRVIYRKLYCKFFQKELYAQLSIREKEFESFINIYLKRSEPIVGRKNLEKATESYSSFILGSDQVWNPINLGTDYYTLNWIPDNKKKATYASSFGVSRIPRYQRKKTAFFLNRIEFLSTREKQGAIIIKDLTGRQAEVVCDPTLLVNRECWVRLKGEKRIVEEKYIFCYFLGSNRIHRNFAEKVKKETGYILVALQHLDEFVKEDVAFADYKPFDINPAGFVNLIANAEIVLTDSFHGTIFSILFKKKFFTMSRHSEGRTESTNSRLDTLLSTLKLENRKITGTEAVKGALNQSIDFDQTYKELEIYRSSSARYLDNVLENIYVKN